MARVQGELDRPASSVIGKGFTIQAALLTGSDSIRVDGTIIGAIELDGPLHLSEDGYIEGDVQVSSARIAGQVSGNIHCRALLHLASTAYVTGDIFTASVIVDEGAVLRGRCKTGSVVASE